MRTGTYPVVIPENGVVQGVEGLLSLPPWMRREGVSLATDDEFLTIEPELRAAGEFWPSICDDQRDKRGLERHPHR